MKVTARHFFDEQRRCWRVRIKGAGIDTKINVPAEEFEREGVSSDSRSKRADDVASDWAKKKRSEFTREAAPEPMSLDQIFALMKARNPENVSDATWNRNEVHFRNLRRLPTKQPLAEARPDLIDREMAALYRDARVSESAKGRTIQGELALLKQLLRFGFEDAARTTGMGSVRFTKMPKIDFDDEQGMVALTVDQFFAVLEATHQVMPRAGHVTRRRLIFGVTSMVRKTPLMALRSEWIDLRDPWLDVPKEWMKGKGGQKRPSRFPCAGGPSNNSPTGYRNRATFGQTSNPASPPVT